MFAAVRGITSSMEELFFWDGLSAADATVIEIQETVIKESIRMEGLNFIIVFVASSDGVRLYGRASLNLLRPDVKFIQWPFMVVRLYKGPGQTLKL